MKHFSGKILLIPVGLCLAGCSLFDNYQQPLSNSFSGLNFEYALNAYRDSLNVIVSSVGDNVVLNYRIQKLKGKYDSYQQSSMYFIMPITDTLSMTWYNGQGESLYVPLHITSSVFDSLPPGNDSVAHVVNPDEIKTSLSVSITWFSLLKNSTSWVACRDSTGSVIAGAIMNDTLDPMLQKTYLPPTSNCKLGQVIITGIDSVAYGKINRRYIAEYLIKSIRKCTVFRSSCTIL